MPVSLLSPRLYSPATKPPWGSRIDPSHPLARGLVFGAVLNEGGGTPADVVTGSLSAGGYGTWVNTPRGAGQSFNGTSQQDSFGDRAGWRPGSNDWTMVVFANPISEATQRGMLTKRNASTNYHQLALYSNLDSSGNAQAGSFGAVFFSDTSINRTTATTSTSLIDGNYHQFVASMVKSTSVISLYLDGISQSVINNSLTVADAYTQADPLIVGSGNGVLNFNRTIVYAYYWLRALSVGEIAWLYNEPWAMFRSDRQQFWMARGASGVVSASIFNGVNAPNIFGGVF